MRTLHTVLTRTLISACISCICLTCTAAADPSASSQTVGPGIGIFFKKSDVASIRTKILKAPCKPIYDLILKRADEAVAQWPTDKKTIEPLASKLLDLNIASIPDVYIPAGGKEAATRLYSYANGAAAAAAFAYTLTGDKRYAQVAWEVFEQCGRVTRWGWFAWEGAHMPQIPFGTTSRNLVLIADCVWDTLTPDQQLLAKQIVAEKCVEPYFRLVLQTPGMPEFHLRAFNQGCNVLSAALIGSLFVGDSIADNKVWYASLLQTYNWAITHDIGWMGGNLQGGPYWEVSMQNLYTAAVALANVKNIDLRIHPGFSQAAFFPVMHDSTVPVVGRFVDPIDAKELGPTGMITGKPIELPRDAIGGSWWLDYARRFPESPAKWFIQKVMVAPDIIISVESHQGALAEILKLVWWDDALLVTAKPPDSNTLFTDRMASMRSGFGKGQTFFYFNGDIFLSAKDEILGTTAAMNWHYPWAQFQIAESGIETEGESYAPSMVIKSAFVDDAFASFQADSGPTNVNFHPTKQQRSCYEHYIKRQRTIVYSRPGTGLTQYYVIMDSLQHKQPKRWYAWTWHLWNSTINPTGNFGIFLPQGQNAVRAARPNAHLWIQFLSPETLSFEQQGIPGQPQVEYVMDHNVQMLRAIAGNYTPTDAKPVRIPVTAWSKMGELQNSNLYIRKPPTESQVVSSPVSGLMPGVRYRCKLRCKSRDYTVYEDTAWEVSLQVLDSLGKVIAEPQSVYGEPDPLKLGAPRSNAGTHDWTETVTYFDAPASAASIRATFEAAGSAHRFHLGELWLSDIEIEPLGIPNRGDGQVFAAILMPMGTKESAPEFARTSDSLKFTHPNGDVDTISLQGEELSIKRHNGSKLVSSYTNKITSSHLLPLTNSLESQKQLAAALAPILDSINIERDRFTVTGKVNKALKAKVTATDARDARFLAANVIDNQTVEYPIDGKLDYSLGVVTTADKSVGYSADKESLTDDPDTFPLYVKPTYWLLPQGKTGSIELAFDKPVTVENVRLLNTSNAGLNDYATLDFRIELLDAAHQQLAVRDGAFGNTYDRPFQQAFIEPKWFNHYTKTYGTMLDPGTRVPFGTGWQDVSFDSISNVSFARVEVLSYWGLGGGLNEVQVY